MATKEEKYAEAYRRGILPADKKALYEEAVKRGLMQNPELKAQLEGINLPDIELPPRETAAETALKESARSLITAGANIADIVPEVGDAFASAGFWALSQFGFGDGTYTPVARFKDYLPEYAKPQTEEGKLAAEMLPYFVPSPLKIAGIVAKTGKGAEAFTANIPELSSRISGAGKALSKRLATTAEQSVIGALAQSGATDESFAGLMVENVAAGEILHWAGRALGAGYKYYKGVPGETKAKFIQSELEGVTPETGVDVPEILDVAKTALKGRSASSEELAYSVNPSQEILSAAQRLELDDLLIPSHYSTNTAYQAIEQGLKSVPGSLLDAQERRAIDVLTKKTDELISEFGGTIDKSELSDRFKSRMTDQIRNLEGEANDIFRKVDEVIPGNTPVGTLSTMKLLKGRVEIMGGEEFLSQAERNVMRQMDDASLPTYARLSAVRQQIGDALSKKQGPFKDMATGELKQLYRALADDQQQAANFYGIGDLYRTANDLVFQRKGLEKDLVNLLGKDLSDAITKKAGLGVQQLSKGDYRTLDRVLQRVPADMREDIVISALNDAFTIGSRKEVQLNIPGFVAWYEKLQRNPEAMNRITKNLPAGAMQRLNDIFEVSRGIRNAKSKEITTGRIDSLLSQFDKDNGALAKIFGTAGKTAVAAAAGAAGGPVAGAGASTALSLMGRAKDARTVAADKMLSSRDFREVTKQVAAGKAETAEQRQRLETLLAKSEAFKQWQRVLSGNELATLERQGFINWLTGVDE